MNFAYLNGQFVEEDKACVSVLDQGFLYGDGIFESFRSVGAKLYQFPLHYERLVQSAQALSYPLLFAQDELQQQLLELQRRNQLVNGYFRITITRGLGQVGFLRDMESSLTCLIIGREFKGLDEPLYQQGVALTVAKTRRNAPEAINPKIKSISNLNSLLGKLEAKAAGVLEVIMLNSRGHLCEGAASNLFWVRDGWVFTPAASTGLLEGVTRSTIMRLCEEKLKLRVITGEFRLQDLHYSDEVFITSTSLEVLPVVRVDDFVIGKGGVGPVARDLRRELHRDMGMVV
ncbi:aminotransferase class IV [Geoalkalibacter halelectricus]|uniref:branched-chain-amino-acid transaminase n=1 Tax=Geoalkalibacter halelectricus TaxID=2847045 RepID=A0ABY5ZIH3_9BACT|nr:aminotransferase class IV [Geoalkalibacter halelectricus]MDO3377304.1 aminotransferase class IV [Geoalkalibacter halelectricus]UWZ78942.1 aminotransferase class IV [Geoalkalibacter halelectricus]